MGGGGQGLFGVLTQHLSQRGRLVSETVVQCGMPFLERLGGGCARSVAACHRQPSRGAAVFGDERCGGVESAAGLHLHLRLAIVVDQQCAGREITQSLAVPVEHRHEQADTVEDRRAVDEAEKVAQQKRPWIGYTAFQRRDAQADKPLAGTDPAQKGLDDGVVEDEHHHHRDLDRVGPPEIRFPRSTQAHLRGVGRGVQHCAGRIPGEGDRDADVEVHRERVGARAYAGDAQTRRDAGRARAADLRGVRHASSPSSSD